MSRGSTVLGRIFVSCAAALLLPFWANALEAGIEDAFLKIIVNPFDGGPAPDVNTLDANGDGVLDRAQFRLLDAVLRDDAAPHHAEILAAYQANLARLEQDNTLGVRCNFMEILYHFTCDEFNRHSAGTFTLAEPVAIQKLVSEFANNARITLDPANYNLTLAGLMPGGGDLDGDGYTNAQEFAAVCGNIDAYVAAVMDASKNPQTLPCCANCVLHFTGEPQDARKYVNGTLTLSVDVKDAEGTPHYQWYKNDEAVGADSPALVFSSLQIADSGLYRCVVSDVSETVTSRTAQVTVAEHVAITGVPHSLRMHLGDSYTFTAAVSGGFPPIHFEWFKDGSTIGSDSPQFALANVADTDAGKYWCVIADLYEKKVSAQCTFTVMLPGEGEDEVLIEGETEVEGETVIEGEVATEGEVPGEGEVTAEGEFTAEGEIAGEGEFVGEGEAAPETVGGCAGGDGNVAGTWPYVTMGGFLFFLLGWRSGGR